MSDPVLSAASALLEKILGDTVDTGPAEDKLRAQLGEWQAVLEGVTNAAPYDRQKLVELEALLNNATSSATDPAKLTIMQAIRNDRMLGFALIVLALHDTVRNFSSTWWQLMFAEQTADDAIKTRGEDGDTWKIKQLPAPDTNHKYLILSDIHRDSAGDMLDPFLAGSIDHFAANKALYLDILNQADADGFTVIEGGDCEELWFVGQSYPTKAGGKQIDPAVKLQEIITSNNSVQDGIFIYDKLAEMHAEGKYIRVQGNHDSYVKDPAVRQVLDSAMTLANPPPGAPSFEIYDACIIPGVKTMMEHSGLDLILDGLDALWGEDANKTPEQAQQEIVDKLLKGRLGLTAHDYTKTTRMLVCHGHQFDFWNNPRNEILGLIISNTAGVPVDEIMDPLLDVEGIAMEGSPFINFGAMFANLPIFDSWIAQQSALKFAHEIQHQSNSKRLLSDTIMFSETVPTLWGAFGLLLSGPDESGALKTPAQSRSDLGLNTVPQISPTGGFAALEQFMRDALTHAKNGITYFNRHAMNHVCLGHTHAPHSQPYFSVRNLGALAPPFQPIFSAMDAVLPNVASPRLKTGYFNSGTAGWMEGVVWAIEIGETGQARLVYFTKGEETGSPIKTYMDWELTPGEGTNPNAANNSQAIKNFIGSVKPAGWDPAAASATDLYEALRDRIADLTDNPKLFENWMQEAITMPIGMLALAILDILPLLEGVADEYSLEEIEKYINGEVERAEDLIEKLEEKIFEEYNEQLEKMRDFSLDVLMSIRRRELFGFPATDISDQISISIKHRNGKHDSADNRVIGVSIPWIGARYSIRSASGTVA